MLYQKPTITVLEEALSAVRSNAKPRNILDSNCTEQVSSAAYESDE